MSCGTELVRIEPVDVYIGKNQVQKEKITCLKDVASSLNNKWFPFYSTTEKFYVWFNVGGAGVDPAVPEHTEIEVAIAANATAVQVASALKTALDAHADIIATQDGKVVNTELASEGYAIPSRDSEAAPTMFAFELVQIGDTYEKIGLIDGDVELGGLAQEMQDVTAHQTGTTTLAQLLTGAGKPELTFNMKEVSKDKIAKLRRYTSGEYMPSIAGATGLVGGGTVGLFKPVLSTRTVLHPVSKDDADKTRDVALWKCTVDIDSLPFSGENQLTVPVTIKANYDCTKPKAVNVWSYGDWTQIEAE